MTGCLSTSPGAQAKKLKITQVLFTNLVKQLNTHKEKFSEKDLEVAQGLVKVTAVNLTLWKDSIVKNQPRVDVYKVIDKNLFLLSELLANKGKE